MQSSAIPRRGNPGLPCPRNSAFPLHSHCDLLKAEEPFHHNFPTQPWSSRPTRNWKSQSLVLSTSFYTKGLTALPFFHPLSASSHGQSRAGQGRAGLAVGSAGLGPTLLCARQGPAGALSLPRVPCVPCVTGTGCWLCCWLPSLSTGPGLCPALSCPGSGAGSCDPQAGRARRCHRLPALLLSLSLVLSHSSLCTECSWALPWHKGAWRSVPSIFLLGAWFTLPFFSGCFSPLWTVALGRLG